MQDAGYREVPLYRRDGSIRAHALVDDSYYPWVAPHRWHVGSNGYARWNERHESGEVTAHLMHREVMGLAVGDGRQIDHINRDRFDNRRANLRIVTHHQNMQNRPSVDGATSRFRGVHWDKRKGRWRAKGTINGRAKSLGTYQDEIMAAIVVEEWRRKVMPSAETDPELAGIIAVAARLAA